MKILMAQPSVNRLIRSQPPIMATALRQPLPYQQKWLTLLFLKWRMSGTTKSP
jgi:hypothetical protein